MHRHHAQPLRFRWIRLLALIAVTGALWWARGASAAEDVPGDALDAALYAALLETYTRPVDGVVGTAVDYRGLLEEPRWKELVSSLERSRPDALPSREARLAFWVNAYNVLAIDVVLAHWPVESIRDAGWLLSPVWRQEVARIGGEPVTLHEIEHEILRPMGDPRIHAAIVCASTSCPSLRREPYRAAQIDAQLDDATRTFLANEQKGLAVERAGGRVRLSKIFDWFEGDFEARSPSVLAWVERYAPAEEREWLAEHRDGAEVAFFDYDWSLNDLASARAGG